MDALTLIPSQTALLVVDVQERLMPAMHAPHAARLLACLDVLLEAARLFDLPVFATEQYPQGLGPTVLAVRERLASFDPPVHPAEKTVFSALAPAEVARGLASSGARSVIVTGVESHVCVFQTARELKRRGFHVHVPFDAVASRDPQCREAALALLARHGVSVTTTETVVFDLLGDAKSPHFRPLSKLVRALV